MEMAFMDQDSIMSLVEDLVKAVFQEVPAALEVSS
jgi:aspartyl-tRNA synthetase